MTGRAVLDRARGLKHRAFVALKPARWRWYSATEPAVRAWHALRPYRYDHADFAGTFVSERRAPGPQRLEAVPRRIFVVWAGDNPMSAPRQRALDDLRARQRSLEVVMVTPASLGEWVVPAHPLHPAYDDLSLIHRSDYLRAYLLHHHGGAYADVKSPLSDWGVVLDRMDDSDAWLGGYRVPLRLMTPNMPDPAMDRLMRRCSERRLGQCAYASRPGTPLTEEWLREVERRLDTHAEALRRHPGDARGDTPGYPVRFTELLGQVVDPLQIKYSEHLLYDDRLRPRLEGYL